MVKTKEKSKAARSEAGGEVLFLGSYSEIPESNVPLMAKGRKVYDEWCRTLLKSGLLTLATREYVEMLAVATDDIDDAVSRGKRPSRQAMEAKRAAMMKLEKLDAGAAIITPAGGENPYKQFGFARRAKEHRFKQ